MSLSFLPATPLRPSTGRRGWRSPEEEPMAETDYRAHVWNSFLKLTWMQAKQVASDAHKKPNKDTMAHYVSV
jgi:hypothetical protein